MQNKMNLSIFYAEVPSVVWLEEKKKKAPPLKKKKKKKKNQPILTNRLFQSSSMNEDH